MIQQKADYKRYSLVGPGGHRCPCCYPAPGKKRNFMERIWKRREKQQFQRIFPLLLEEPESY